MPTNFAGWAYVDEATYAADFRRAVRQLQEAQIPQPTYVPLLDLPNAIPYSASSNGDLEQGPMREAKAHGFGEWIKKIESG